MKVKNPKTHLERLRKISTLKKRQIIADSDPTHFFLPHMMMDDVAATI